MSTTSITLTDTNVNSIMNETINSIVEWASPRLTATGRMVTEGARTGYLDDVLTQQLADWLKSQFGRNPQVSGQAQRGYEITLDNGLVVGVTRQRRGYGRSGRVWCAYCRRQAGTSWSGQREEAKVILAGRPW